MALFDSYVVVDWSAANAPRQGRDSIWICRHDGSGIVAENPRTRHAAQIRLAELIVAGLDKGRRMLVGFDFPFGYPAGFAARLGLPGAPWRAVWDEISRLLDDDERNRNNRFEVAEILNRRVSRRGFPFWGCPAARANGFLAPKHHRGHRDDGLAERRLVDLYVPSAQPCWKLLGVGSVGSQALTGIPVVRALRDDPHWRGRAAVWPFETGLGPPNGAQLVFAEVYPSLWGKPLSAAPSATKDEAQVRAVSEFFAARDAAGDFGALFAGDPRLSPAERHRIETEEAWMLGLTERRVRAGQAQVPHSPRLPPPIPSPACGGGLGWGRGEGRYDYLRDPAEIYRRSFALIRAEAPLDRFPPDIEGMALRLAHAAGDAAILADLAWSPGAVRRGKKALAAGAPILVDAAMVAAGIASERLPAANRIICTLREPETVHLAAKLRTTRSAAAVELWRPNLAGALVAIGNAPTALFRLLELVAAGAGKPALILGFPVGFVGAAEAKAALAAFGRGLAFVTLHGRRGGSALAAAAVNALLGAR
ncbi:MAG TPA: precorrin-8X methylmutase [Stellaceae bacterium]|nr:precorrin-8X methylmutase [Stellaceae bacterium]